MHQRLILLGALCASGTFTRAQVVTGPSVSAGSITGTVTPEVRNAAGLIVGVGSSGMMPSAVVGTPYSAEELTERTQTLADGTHITQTQSRVRQYRDSQGRTRTERQPTLIGPRPQPDLPPIIEIRDPVAGATYMLQPRQKTAQRIRVGRPAVAPTLALNAPPPPPPPTRTEFSRPEMATESLGTQLIGGVLAEGTRRTVTLPTGSIGNDRPISTVTETWFSPELKITVASKTSDPRSGETIMRLENLSRTEPDPSLFQVPADYQIQDQTIGGPN